MREVIWEIERAYTKIIETERAGTGLCEPVTNLDTWVLSYVPVIRVFVVI